jgi:imidazole glycerol-phosphate synthase subunit HisF
MLRPRIIPCLLIKNKGLVKTINFDSPKYVGDPINAVRIFNEKEVDELLVIDIVATVEAREPDYGLIEHLAEECRMPLCYGGGIKNSSQIGKVIGLGVEKVALSSSVIERPEIITEASKTFGNQSVVVVLDVKKNVGDNNYQVYTHNGRKATGRCPVEMAKLMETLGVGEIVINSIDNDGQMKGYDLNLTRKVKNVIHVPLTILGGAGSLQDIGQMINMFGTIGAAAGSLFVFKGVYRAVLINYPSQIEKDTLIHKNLY